MVLSIISFLLAFIIAMGRQTAALGKVEKSLWFLSNYEGKRAWFSISSILFGILALLFNPFSPTIIIILSTTVLLILGSFLFDFKYIFPEVKSVERTHANTVNIAQNTEVIGINYNNIAVAYPLDVVIPRHIVHDKIGDANIVVSYCAICRSALIFSAEIEGINLYFQVSAVWRRNLVMIDDQTKSLWQQATGECIYGKFKGKNLKLLSGENTNWRAWLQQHPNTEYATKCHEARKGYLTREEMIKGLNYITPKVTPPGFTDLQGLPTRETVFGIDYNGVSKAYALSEIKSMGTFVDFFNGKELKLEYNKRSEYLSAFTMETNRPVIVEKHWWLGWKEFHPETEIWKIQHLT